jgi:hypothetical protein
MSHLTDLADQVTHNDDAWAITRDRDAGERAMHAANTLANAAAATASRLKDELDRADIRAVYDNDPHRSRS